MSEPTFVLGADAPAVPTPEDRAWLLDTLARLIAAGGHAPFLAAPVEPGPAAFPDRWRPTLVGVRHVLRRLAWHAGLGDRAIELADARADAVATAKLVATEVEVGAVSPATLAFTVHSIGADDVVGTLAHEVGVAVAVTLGVLGGDPYRALDPGLAGDRPDEDLRVGSVGAVWAGLGVLAANASYQQYSGGTYAPHLGFAPLEYEVIRAGHLPMPALAFLVAVQAEVSGQPPKLPAGPQRDELATWRRALRGRRAELRDRLGIPASASAGERPVAEPWPEQPDAEEAPTTRGATRVFRVPYNRGGPGAMLGILAGGLAGTTLHSPVGLGVGLGAGLVLGLAVGRASRRDRCSECINVIPDGAPTCPRCGGAVAGTIRHRNQRLDDDDAG